MRPIMRFVLGVATLALILVGVAFALPSQVTVARSIIINAPESVIFPYLTNLHKFPDWSPWAVRDPQLRVTYSGPESGKGARTEWESSQKAIGTGLMEITEAEPNRHAELVVNLNGLEGTTYYDIAPAGSGSKVTWGFGYNAGTSPFGRWKGLMLDRLIAGEFQSGLVKLKQRVEADRAPITPPAAPPPPVVTAPAPEAAPGSAVESTTVVPETSVPQSTSAAPEPAPAPEPPPASAKPPKKKRQQ
ncbi:MAG TPA: SRPBCC family protein [Methyloceanibacter sp.]|jgi:Polyketide cyclase / dehydrase and lipid transport